MILVPRILLLTCIRLWVNGNRFWWNYVHPYVWKKRRRRRNPFQDKYKLIFMLNLTTINDFQNAIILLFRTLVHFSFVYLFFSFFFVIHFPFIINLAIFHLYFIYISSLSSLSFVKLFFVFLQLRENQKKKKENSFMTNFPETIAEAINSFEVQGTNCVPKHL